VDYATVIDTRRFDDLGKVVTPDAYIDYRALPARQLHMCRRGAPSSWHGFGGVGGGYD
jgi:hypothetical protein